LSLFTIEDIFGVFVSRDIMLKKINLRETILFGPTDVWRNTKMNLS